MASRNYYLVLYDVAQTKGVNHAMPSMIDESTAKVLLQDARATITRKRGGKFLVVDRRLFEVDNVDGTTTLYIICDVERVKP